MTIAVLLLFGGGILVGCSPSQNDSVASSTEVNHSETIASGEQGAKTNKVDWPYYEIKKDGEIKGYLLGTVHSR